MTTKSSTTGRNKGQGTSGTAAERSPAHLSDDHKAALAEGRSQGHAIRRYLEALDGHRARRGRPVDVTHLRQRLDQTIEELGKTKDALRRVLLAQKRLDLEDAITAVERGATDTDFATLEDEFVAAVGPYSQRKGIRALVWREAGVPRATLRRAGLSR